MLLGPLGKSLPFLRACIIRITKMASIGKCDCTHWLTTSKELLLGPLSLEGGSNKGQEQKLMQPDSDIIMSTGNLSVWEQPASALCHVRHCPSTASPPHSPIPWQPGILAILGSASIIMIRQQGHPHTEFDRLLYAFLCNHIPLHPLVGLQQPYCYQKCCEDCRHGWSHDGLARSLSDILSLTTTTICFIGSRASSPLSPSLFPHMHSPLCRHNPLARMFMIRPPIRSATTLTLVIYFVSGWHTGTCLVLLCWSHSCPYVTPHSSTTCTTVLSYLYNLFSYYQVLVPLFCYRESILHAIPPLDYNTSRDSSPGPPRAPTLSSNQECLFCPMSLWVSEAKVGEAN